MIYLDHNATTPIDEKVLEAMAPFLQTFYGNPSSLYRIGRIASSAIGTAREQVAALVSVQPKQVIFTSGGTEANNLAINSAQNSPSLAISAIEHPSITAPALRLQEAGTKLTVLDVDQQGLVTEQAIEQAIKQCVGFVSIMMANNETGVIQDIALHTQKLRQHGIIVHTDAVQAVGKLSVSFEQLGVQLMSLSAHKIYAPKGCGALIFEKGSQLIPNIVGGGQEQGFRSGTENVAAIVGFGKAAELAKTELENRMRHCRKLKTLLETGLQTIPKLFVFSQQVDRLDNTVQFGIEGVDGEMLLMQLDSKDICVSSASACASGAGKPSPVLTAMGIEPELAKSAIRVSLGQQNTETEITEFIKTLNALL